MRGNVYSVIMRRKRIIVVTLVTIVLIAIGVTAYFSSFEPPQIESVKISSIDSVSLSGLNLTFSMKIKNPNRLDMMVKSIKYSLMLTQTSQILMNGTCGEITIPAHGSTEIFINSTIHSAPVISLAYMTIFTKSVMMEINVAGTAPGLFSDHNFSSSHTFDAYPYISDQVNNIARSVPSEVQSLSFA